MRDISTIVKNCVSCTGLVFCLVLFSACATTGPEAPTGSISERVMARWNALLSGDLPAAYEFLSPAVRTSVSSLQYQRSVVAKQVRWTGADYIGESCEETVCKVQISIDYAVYGALPGVRSFEDTQVIEESWIYTDGDWYFVPPQ
jgi:hypothetical protein